MSASLEPSLLISDDCGDIRPIDDSAKGLAESDLAALISPGDKLFPVATAAEKVTGTRPHPTTVCRHCRKGASGVLLPSLIVNGRRMTSLEAYRQWLREVTARRNVRKTNYPVVSIDSRTKSGSAESAEAKLDATRIVSSARRSDQANAARKSAADELDAVALPRKRNSPSATAHEKCPRLASGRGQNRGQQG